MSALLGLRANLVPATIWRSRKRLLCEWWSIGICDRSIGTVLECGALGPVRWLAPGRGSAYYADPFVWPGTGLLLCEEFPLATGIGRIVVLRERGGTLHREATLFDDSTHRSYPFIWSHCGVDYMLPEESASGPTTLYRMSPDLSLLPVAIIAPDRRMLDATIFDAGGRIWIAATDTGLGKNDNLCLFYADRPEGPWHAHHANPVLRDNRLARSGGTPFHHRNRLYRPSQDCTNGYGEALVIAEILTLTPDDFDQRIVCRLTPDPLGLFPDGLHTLTVDGERCVVDGKRLIFVPGEIGRKIHRRLRRTA